MTDYSLLDLTNPIAEIIGAPPGSNEHVRVTQLLVFLSEYLEYRKERHARSRTKHLKPSEVRKHLRQVEAQAKRLRASLMLFAGEDCPGNGLAPFFVKDGLTNQIDELTELASAARRLSEGRALELLHDVRSRRGTALRVIEWVDHVLFDSRVLAATNKNVSASQNSRFYRVCELIFEHLSLDYRDFSRLVDQHISGRACWTPYHDDIRRVMKDLAKVGHFEEE